MGIVIRKELERTRLLLDGYQQQGVSSSDMAVGAATSTRNILWLPVIFKRALFYADKKDQEQKLQSRFILYLGISFGAVCTTGKIYCALILPALALIELQKLKQTSRSRAEAFEKDYTALLLSLASSVRTGRDPLQALVESVKLFPPQSVVAGELSGVRQALESGRTEKGAILRFAETINHPDIPLFRSAFVLARKEGSALGECLHRLTRVTRNRQSFRRRSRSAVAMQKMSAYGIALCTAIVCLFQVITNAEGFMEAIEHPVGSILLCLGGGLILVGLGWMNQSTKTRV